jgi:Mg-chelatase subunit ChlD
MLDYRITFEEPRWLLLLAVIPLLWWIGRRSLTGMGRGRRWVALALRSLLVTLVVGALAEVQLVRSSDRLAVLYVVDRSASMPVDQFDDVAGFIQQATKRDANERREDRSGVISFGRDAAVETPPLPGEEHLPRRFETQVDANATDLAAALRLAQAVFPADAAKRVVVISDGNETSGDSLAQAEQLASLGIGIDVVPIARGGEREIAVEKISLPQEIRQGTPFEARVVVNHSAAAGDERPVSGRLRISRTAGGQTQTLADRQVELPLGKQVYSFQEEIESADFYTYTANFVPDEAAGDTQVENNQATAFTHVRGKGQVLLIQDFTKAGQFDELVALLRRHELEVTVQSSSQLFANLADLQRFDLVILADVARTTGVEANQLSTFSDAQIELLAQNTQHLGSGLIVIGGPDSFGAGGWTNTPLEKAMPVDFQVKNAKVVPSGALLLVIDSSGSMDGEKLEMSKAAAIAAVKMLSREDFVGVVAFDSAPHWIVPVTKIESPEAIFRRIARLESGGGTDMEPGMWEGYQALRQVNAAVKHMIVLTDGQTHGSNFGYMARVAREGKITTSTVAVGADAAIQLLNEIAIAGGGKYYQVANPRAIPRIFMKEAMRVSRPVIFEDAAGIPPQRVASHEILAGIEGDLPPMTGFVMTSPKRSALVEIPLMSPRPAGNQNAVLATWQYGLGRATALTTDAGQRWTKTWPQWSGYEPFLTQMVRWTMRPTDKQSTLNVFAEADNGAIQVVVTALDADDQFVNFLDLSGTLLGPDGKPLPIELEQTAPGRYVGRTQALQPGSYFLAVSGGPNEAPVRAGVNAPYSAEFRERESNVQLLRNMAALVPEGGRRGAVIGALASDGTDPVDANVFRGGLPRASSRQDAWHLLVFAVGLLFLVDVFNRRVIVSFAWAGAWAGKLYSRIRGRSVPDQPAAALQRLQARKSQIERELAERRASTHYEPQSELASEELVGQVAVAVKSERPLTALDQQLAPEAEAESYASRLRKAKQSATKGRRSGKVE